MEIRRHEIRLAVGDKLALMCGMLFDGLSVAPLSLMRGSFEVRGATRGR